MKAAYDLHIHSCLSPCADNDMTPENIAAMARLKGLSVISLTDHNAGHNLEAMALAAKAQDLIFVPGIEVTTREEVHVLVYFPGLRTAIDFGDRLYGSLPDIDNRPEIFGSQIVMDVAGIQSGTLDKLLLQATPYSIDDIVDMAKAAGGGAVPAHINRDSFSILSNLGFIPPGLFACVEIADALPCPAVDASLRKIFSSDAHSLGSISEPRNYFPGFSTVKDLILYIK
ncbi:MAG: PHP domain-containing protein [Eubacteriales bacterium]|nr:PHP domain-containing protein [Eubacteriales bacterium]